MNILLNNRTETFEQDRLTVRDILNLKNFTFKMLVVKINGSLVKKDAYETAFVHDGDELTILHLVSGG